MKNLLKCISILLIIAGLNDSLTAQPQYYNFNNGSSSNSFPFNMSGGKDVQSLFIPGAFNQPGPAPAGTITSIFVLLSADMVNRVYTNLTIKMGQSTITDLTVGSYYAGPMTTVYSRASVTINASGWLEFVLDTPFAYDPTQSLITDMGVCSATGSVGTVWNSMTSGIKRVWSVAGCPFAPYASGDASTLNFGITLTASGPTVVTTPATSINATTATLTGTVNANGSSTTVTFNYGLTSAYGTTVPGVPSPVTGNAVTAVAAAITGLTPSTLYHFRVNGTNSNGSASGSDLTFTTCTVPIITITGTSSLCVNSGYYNYTTQSNCTNYTWTISSGGTITSGQGTNVIQVTWNQAGAQWVAVNYTNSTGCSAPAPVQFAVTVNPLPGSAGTVTGSAAVCGGANGVAYYVAPVQYATDYIWTLPAGAVIASGAGTNSITVNFNANASSGNISVYGNNICGNGNSSPPLAVTVNLFPAAAGVINGHVSICDGDRGVVYVVAPITNATGYTWSVPPGAIIAFGSNTNSIAVDYDAGAQSGNITVAGSNSCGNGTASPDFPVTVNPIPPAPTITLNLVVLTSSAPAGNQWYFENNPIPGATGQTYTAQNTGWYWVTVTLNGCTSDPSNHEYVDVVGIDKQMSPDFTIFPVPNDGRFTVSMTSPLQETFTIQVFNNLGVMISELPGIEMKGTVEKVIDLRPVANGIYTVVIRNSNEGIVKKVVVKK